MAEWEILPLTDAHLGSLAELEVLCFSEPWSENALAILTRDGGFGVVALLEGSVVAYGGMTYVLDEGCVTNIATHPLARRQGLGEAVARALLAEAQRRGLTSVFLEVRESNLPARSLYEKLGFRACGVRKNFYRKPVESAIQMVLRAEEREEKEDLT